MDVVEANKDVRDRQSPVRRSRPRWWHRPAGVAVAVAVMVVGSTATANAAGATPRKPTPAEIDAVAAEPADGPVHGEFPVVAADGTVQTQRWQWGEVVAVLPAADRAEPASITVASEDGYASDYRVDPDQAAALTVGDVVTVVGTVPAG
jgi:hypothetical protein